MTFYSLTLYAQLSGFKVLVRANRLGAKSDLSRKVHDRMISELNHRLRLASSPLYHEAGDEPYLREQIETDDGRPIQLCDYFDYDPATNEYRLAGSRQWIIAEFGDHPSYEAIEADQLDGLKEIIDDILIVTGVHFQASRIVWN